MSLFKSTKEKKNREPTEQALLTEALVAKVWSSRDEDGRVRIHWNIGRADGRDPTRHYKTLRLESIFEMPEFLAKFAFALSRIEDLPQELIGELEELAKQMAAVAELRKANGTSSSALRKEGGGILNF